MTHRLNKRNPELGAEIEWGRCWACGSVAAWPGYNVRCDECSEGVYEPCTEAEAREAGAL